MAPLYIQASEYVQWLIYHVEFSKFYFSFIIQKFIISLVNEPFEELGWEDEGSHLNKYNLSF